MEEIDDYIMKLGSFSMEHKDLYLTFGRDCRSKKYMNRKKLLIYNIGSDYEKIEWSNKKLSFTKFVCLSIPDEMIYNGKTELEIKAEKYDYLESIENKEWYVCSSDSELFVGYSSEMFAQEEVLVAEHPVLIGIKKELNLQCKSNSFDGNDQTINQKFSPYVYYNSRIMPILIENVERRLKINLYGEELIKTEYYKIPNHIEVLKTPTHSNLINITCPRNNSKDNIITKETIEIIFKTIFSGYSSAKINSADKKCVIHTSHWGCGANGCNKYLICILQILISNIVGIEKLCYHNWSVTEDKEESNIIEKASEYVKYITNCNEIKIDTILENLYSLKLKWSDSDNN